MVQLSLFLATGVAAGILAGIFGVGGGIIIVPMLVYLFKYPQHAANGTSLVALLGPVGLMGVVAYYRAGKIDASNIKAGLLIALGIFIGTFFGSQIAVAISGPTLRKAFAVFLIVVGMRMFFK